MNGRNIVCMILTTMFSIVVTSLFASDNNERFALHGRAAPENFAVLQASHDAGQVRSGGKKLLSSGSPSYPDSIGGNKSYEYISSFTVTPKDGYYKITVKVICPKLYDAAGYPGYGSTLEYVNVWIDWNGDYSWSDSECVMAKSSANYKKILADNKILYFETTVKDASTAGGTFKARAMLGYGYNPTNPATYSWTWGDVMDVDVSFVSAEPEIYGVTIGAFASAGSISGGNAAVSGVNPKVNANNAIIAGRDNYIYPEIKINRKYADSILANSNYKVIVSLDGEEIAKGTVGYGPYMGIQENGEWFDIYPVVDENGNTLKWNPPIVTEKSKYGEKRLAVRLDCDNKLVCHLPLDGGYTCYVFYPANEPIDGKPMWFWMWHNLIDGLNKFQYDNAIGGAGLTSSFSNLPVGLLKGKTLNNGDYKIDVCDKDNNEVIKKTYVFKKGQSYIEEDVQWSFLLQVSSSAWGIADPIIFQKGHKNEWETSEVKYPIDEVFRTVKHELLHKQIRKEDVQKARISYKVTSSLLNLYREFPDDNEGKLLLNGEWEDGDGIGVARETKNGYGTDPYSKTDTFGVEKAILKRTGSYAWWGTKTGDTYRGTGDNEYYVRRETDDVRAQDYYSKDWSFPGSQYWDDATYNEWVETHSNSQKLSSASKLLTKAPVSTLGTYTSELLDQSVGDVVLTNNDSEFIASDADVLFTSFNDVTEDFSTQGLLIDVGIQHSLEGNWRFTAYLFGTNGQAIAKAETIKELSSNDVAIRFKFSPDVLVRVSYAGPFVVGRVVCNVPQNAIENVYSDKNVLTTKDYSAYECKVTKPIVGSKMSDYSDAAGLHVVMPVTVPEAGTYAISAYLATTNGMNLVNATTNCVCAEGKNCINVCFPKDGVFNTKMSGRFLVRDVSVTPEGGEPSLFVCDYETKSYNYSDFDTGERTIEIQPDTIALSVSEDADDPYGLYKGVAVRFAVNNTKSNDYSLYRVSAILADADGYNVAYAEEDLILNGQSVQTLFFSAQDIRESEKDGPYSVKNIRITDRQTGDLIDACTVSGAKTVDLSATDFKSKLTVEEDAIRITPESVGSGVYSGLKLAVPVDAPSAGYVTLSAYVDDNEGHSVGRFENEFEVQSGYNKLELVMDGAKFREAGLNGPYTIKSIEVKHSASPENPYIAECTLETDNYKYTQFIGQGESLWQIGFNESQSVVDEVSNVVVRVVGGCGDSASSVKMYVSYQTATAADLDLARGAVDGVAPKGGLKFPLTLNWAAGEIGEKVVTIPVKTDKTVEADEMFTLQLADAQGMGLSEERVYTVTITDSGYAALAAKVANGTATKTEQTQWSKLQRNGYYVRALADIADGGKVTGSGLCAEGKKVTLKATANKNFTFIGWRDAMGDVVATTATLVIDRSAKPATNSKTSTTITGVSDDVTYYAMFKSNPSVNVTIESSDGYGALVGKVSGTGKYAPGKKVTLKATANAGYIFSYWSWTDEDGDQCYSQEASLSFVMGSADVEVQAMFVLNWEDAAHIYMAVADDDWMSSGAFPDASVRCGIAVNWPIYLDTLSAATVKATGLPAGLKLVQDKETKEYSVTGVPTTVSKTNTKTGETVPSVVKFTVTTAGKNSRTVEKSIFVTPLPQWAYGTFNGVIGHQLGEEDDYRFDGHGTVSMTVAANGKISGKVALDGTNYTFSAIGYSEWSSVEEDDSDAYLMVDVAAKSGKATIPVVLYGYRENQWLSEETENVANCVLWGDGEECGGYDVELRRDLWKDAGNAAALLAWAGAYTYVTADGDVLSFVVDEKGTVKITGSLGAKRKVSVSAPLHPYFIDVYMPPTKTDAAFFERVYLANWHGEATAGDGTAYRNAGVCLATESLDGTGGGTIAANPKYGQVAAGKSVTLTAKAAKDSVFVKWMYENEDGEWTYDYSSTLKLVGTGYDIYVRAVFAAKENVTPPEPYVEDWECWNHAVAGRDFTGVVLVDDTTRPVSFSAKNLPAGLKIDKTTGVISGTPTKAFYDIIIVTATSTVNGKMTGSVEIPMKVRDANAVPEWLSGTFNGYISDTSAETGNPWWGLERGLFTAAIAQDGTVSVEMKTGYGQISFNPTGWTPTTWDYIGWDDGYAEVTMTGANGEQLWLNIRGDLNWDYTELEGYVTGGVFGETELQVIGDRYEFAKVDGKYVHTDMSYFSGELVGTWNLYVHERYGAGVPDSAGRVYPFTHDLETWGEPCEIPSIQVTVKDNGTAVVSGTFLGETISGTVPILVWWCDDEDDCYQAIFWQKLENGKECCIWVDMRSHRESGETSVFGQAWLCEDNDSNISDAELLQHQFKAELTGIAVVDSNEVFYDVLYNKEASSKVSFLPPQTPVVVPKGKTVLFEVSYDFPDGYGGYLWTPGLWPVDDIGSTYNNPSSVYYDRGIAYGFIGIDGCRKTCTIESVSIDTGARLLDDDDKTTYWRIGITPVKITFTK